MEQLIAALESYGVFGLFIVSFCESIFSPILPDLLLIPMGLAAPEMAIYYSIVVTGASVLGGIVGYGIGQRFGPPLVRKCVSPEHIIQIRGLIDKHGAWAIWLAAMAPIPYKFVSISAGAFRINKYLFVIASVFGRAKRFLLEGILIFYYGPKAVSLISEYSTGTLIVIAVVAAVIIAVIQLRSYFARKKLNRCED